jgi:hypothetical protein
MDYFTLTFSPYNAEDFRESLKMRQQRTAQSEVDRTALEAAVS